MKTSRINQRFLEIDYIKVLMMIFIIITHMSFNEIQRRNLLFNFYIELAVPILMIISGFMYSISISKLKNWSSWFYPQNLIKRLYRFLFPFLILVTLEYLFLNINCFSIKNYVKFLLLGGLGPGSYYTPVMVQFILFFPMLFYIFNLFKNTQNTLNIKGLIVLFLLDFLFNFISTSFNMTNSLYRLLYFRYVGFTGIGIFYIRFI